MWTLPLPGTGSSLELVPRWGIPPTLASLLPWLALAIVPLGLILYLYRAELTLVSRTVARFLLAMRLTVILLLLTLVLFQPKLLPASQQTRMDHVLVVVDRTGSMEATDPKRTPVEKLRLARALMLATDLVSNLELDEWIQQAATEKGIRWVADNEYRDDPERRRSLETQRRDRFERVCQRVDGISRTALARALLAEDGGKFLSRLGSRFHVDVMGFARDVWEPGHGREMELFSWPKPAAPGAASPAEIATTDFNIPLERALETAVQEHNSLRGIILLTDGRQNRGEHPIPLAEKLANLNAPLFPVAFGTVQARETLSLVNLEAPAMVLKDPKGMETINALVKGLVRIQGLPRQPVTVVLKLGNEVLSEQRLQHDGSDRDYPVSFPIHLDKEGPQKLTVEIKAPPGWKDTMGLTRQTVINVVPELSDVLVIDGEARWEYHYLTVALKRDPMVKEVSSVVFDQPRVKKIPEEELRKANWPALTMPTEPDALADFDCIILGDPNPEQLNLAERQRLARYVRDNGGTLVIVAGKHFMPIRFPENDPANPAGEDPLQALLPITDARVVESKVGFPIALTDDGQDNPLFQLDEGKGGTSTWNELPPHYWGVVGRKKPAATTLAFYPGDGEQPGKDDTKAGREARSLIAWQSFGKGRVLFVGLDSTWRWRYKVGDRIHHRFWGQLVRWATAGKLLPGGNTKVRYGTPRNNYEPSQDIDVQVRLARDLEPLPAARPGKPYQAVLLRTTPEGKQERAAIVGLLPRPGQPRILDGKARDLPPGKYRVELEIPQLADHLRDPRDPMAPEPARAEFTITTTTNEEMLDVSADWKLLKRLAYESNPDKKSTGPEQARVYTADDARELIDRLTRREEKGVDRTPQPLWEWWPVLVVLMGLVTVEWVTRKFSGLP
jgi:hypothetical protein